jgi:CheY-like chemotaxis protein
VGGGLALAGATFQALLHNPLAEPYIMGISGGAAAGAVAVITMGLAVGSWALPAAAIAYGEPEPEIPRQELHGHGTLLIVDDEDIVLRTGKLALERYGYKVLIAANGLEALEVFREASGEIALVLLDMTMPVMSGEETLAELRRVRPDVRVVVCSGYNELEAVRRFSGAGVEAFIQKPYTSAQLAEKVKAALEGRARGLGAADGSSVVSH